MNLNEYQHLAMRTSPDGHDRIKNGCMGLIGEAGELMDVLKKHMFQSGENPPLPRERIIDELGDIMWYLAELATGIGKGLSDIAGGDMPTFDMNHTELDYLVKTMVELACNIYSAVGVGNQLDNTSRSKAIDTSMYMQMIIDIIRHFARRVGAKLSDVLQGNIDKLKARYPDGFDPERSMNRTEEAPPWEV